MLGHYRKSAGRRGGVLIQADESVRGCGGMGGRFWELGFLRPIRGGKSRRLRGVRGVVRGSKRANVGEIEGILRIIWPKWVGSASQQVMRQAGRVLN